MHEVDLTMPTDPHLPGKAQQPPMSEPRTAESKSTRTAVATGLAASDRDREASVSPEVYVGEAPAVLTCHGQRWLAENAHALLSSNAYAERCGLPLARFRAF
jgi:antitoxin CcdA